MEKFSVCNFGKIDWETKYILKFNVAAVELTTTDIDEFVEYYEKAMNQFDGKFVTLIDASHGKWVGSSVRIYMGKRFSELEHKYFDRQHKSFIAVPNALVKMMLRGINLVSKPIVTQELFSSIEEAKLAAEKEVANW